jgi:hypothetical protein
VAPSFEIHSVKDTRHTDNCGDDFLWIAWMAEPGRAPERFLFSLATRFGPATEEQIRDLIERQAQWFANDRSALAQFRELEVSHPDNHPERRAILLRADIMPPRASALRMY